MLVKDYSRSPAGQHELELGGLAPEQRYEVAVDLKGAKFVAHYGVGTDANGACVVGFDNADDLPGEVRVCKVLGTTEGGGPSRRVATKTVDSFGQAQSAFVEVPVYEQSQLGAPQIVTIDPAAHPPRAREFRGGEKFTSIAITDDAPQAAPIVAGKG